MAASRNSRCCSKCGRWCRVRMNRPPRTVTSTEPSGPWWSPVGESAASPFRVVAELDQFGHEPVAVLTLDFDATVAHRAPRAAATLQAAGQFLQLLTAQRQPRDHRDALAAATGRLARHADACRPGWRRPRDLRRRRLVDDHAPESVHPLHPTGLPGETSESAL